MKRVVILVFLSALGVLASAQSKARNFTLNGQIVGPDTLAKKVFLQYRSEKGWKMDSALVKAGKFSFTGKILEPTMVRFKVKKITESIFLMPAVQRITLNSDGKGLQVFGSEAHRAYSELIKSSAPYDEQYDELVKQYQAYGKANEKEKQAAVEEKIDSIDELRKQKVYRTFLIQNPHSPIAPYVLQEYAGWDINPSQVEPLYDALTPDQKQYPSMQELKLSIDLSKRTQIGSIAMEFEQYDTLDNKVRLSSFRGKYVLVDFWASWCGPCRAENPNVVKAYKQFRDKNFEVLGVSLDRPGQKDRWMRAIHEDGLTWTQVSDLKFWDNEVAVQYGIRAIPQNLLIDPNGIIIGKNLRGEKLLSTLSEMIK